MSGVLAVSKAVSRASEDDFEVSEQGVDQAALQQARPKIYIRLLGELKATRCSSVP